MRLKFCLWICAAVLLWPFAISAQPSVIGTYRLVSFTAESDNGQSGNLFGKQPTGYIIITPTRLMVVITAENRVAGTGTTEKAALLTSTIAYTGKYRIEGAKLITSVDASWNQAWTGTDQARTFQIEGNRLVLLTDKAPSFRDPTVMGQARLVWDRVPD